VKAEPVAKAAPVQKVATAKLAPAVATSAPAAPAALAKTAIKTAPVAPRVQTAAAEAPKVAVEPAQPAAEAASADNNPEFRWPARGRIIQAFKGGSGGNDGINIAVPEGTPVRAAEGGVVAYAGNELKGYGNLVLIRHPNGFVSAYANNGAIDVKRGETVKRGQEIAKSGQSGNVSSPQLHFELRKGSTPVDPTQYLAGL
jgi:murein DD-endopeptidase MepM/ murein hydrolase activator NlpD